MIWVYLFLPAVLLLGSSAAIDSQSTVSSTSSLSLTSSSSTTSLETLEQSETLEPSETSSEPLESSAASTSISIDTISTTSSSVSLATSVLSSSPTSSEDSQATISSTSDPLTTAAATEARVTPVSTTTSISTTSSSTQPLVTSFDSASVSSFIACLQTIDMLGVCNRNYDGGIPEYVSKGQILEVLETNPYNPIVLFVLSPTPLDNFDSICATSYSSSLIEWLATAPISVATQTGNDVMLITNVGPAFGTTVTADSWGSVGYVSEFPWSPVAPCCSSCTVFGGEIKVFHWSTTATASNATTPLTAIDGDFTFTYPSIYVGFQDLSATNLCGLEGLAYPATTVGFSAGELSTRNVYYTTSGYRVDNPLGVGTFAFTAGTWGASIECTSITSLLTTFITKTFISTSTRFAQGLFSAEIPVFSYQQVTDLKTLTVSYNPCFPELSVPAKVYSIDQHWRSCVPAMSAFPDPPYTLTPVGGIGFSSSKIATQLPETTKAEVSAAPSATPQPVTVPPTIAAPLPSSIVSEKEDPAPSSSPLPVDTEPSTSAPVADPVPSSSPLPVEAEPSISAPVADPGPSSSPLPVEAEPSVSAPVGDPPVATSKSNPENPSATIANPAPEITLGSSIFTANPSSAFVVGSQTLVPGSQITFSGTVVSLASGGHSLVVGSSTLAIAVAPTAPVASPTPSFLVFGSQTVQAGGAPITISGGTVISLVSGGASVVVDGSTQAITPITKATTEGAYIIGSQTLSAGGTAITVSGTVISLLPDGSSVVIGGTTTIAVGAASTLIGPSQAVATITQTSVNLGGIIVSVGGFGSTGSGRGFTTSPSHTGKGSTTVHYNGTVFTGAGVTGAKPSANWALIALIPNGLRLLYGYIM